MKLSDLPEVFSLWEKAGLNIIDKKQELKAIQLTVQKNPDSSLVLMNGATIIGAVVGAFNGRRAWVYHFAIHPDFQQSGYGSLLLQKTEEALKKQGAQKIMLGVEYTNLKVMHFYNKFGYSVVNDALWLKKAL